VRRLLPLRERGHAVLWARMHRPEREEPTYSLSIGVQSLHNMLPKRQRAALAWIGSVLRPGGWALLLDKIRIPAEPYELFRSSPSYRRHGKSTTPRSERPKSGLRS
jgi:hypothetical protein